MEVVDGINVSVVDELSIEVVVTELDVIEIVDVDGGVGGVNVVAVCVGLMPWVEVEVVEPVTGVWVFEVSGIDVVVM